MVNHYSVLGVAQHATDADIKKAYRKEALAAVASRQEPGKQGGEDWMRGGGRSRAPYERHNDVESAFARGKCARQCNCKRRQDRLYASRADMTGLQWIREE